MPNNNLNLHETKAEEQRYIIGMLPTQLLIKGTPEGKDLVKKLTKKLSKIPKKRQAQVASVFDDLATTQEKGSITKEDIKIVKDDNSQDANKKVVIDEKTNQKKLEEYFKLFDRNK